MELLPANGSVVSGIVPIEISASDAGSGIANIEVFIEGISISNTTTVPIGIEWDTTLLSNGDYNLTVVATDNADNTVVVSHIVSVENISTTTTTTTEPTIPPTDLSGLILLVIILIIAAGIIVLYMFVLKKR